MSKLVFFLTVMSLTVDSYYCWITDINTKMLNDDSVLYNELQPNDEDNTDKAAGGKQFNLIFPGTKWCGAGNVADHFDDLGAEVEADTCCREHDHCPDLIEGGGTKYNLTNSAFYTRLNCSCDLKFLECLRAANTKTASFIGVIYFNTLQTKCFREDYPVEECIKKTGIFKSKCEEYSYNTTSDKIYQWFDVPDF